MKLFSLLMFLSFSLPALAQDSWKVIHKGKQKLATGVEKPEGNVVTINRADLSGTGTFLIKYTEKEPRTGWTRTITMVDKGENELHTHKGNLFTISNANLKKLFNKANTIYVYTWALPDDPELAARIRIRRVHLSTIKLRG
ncbi:MAG TPA: hypothetical protein VGE66_04535 [Chitinophagaceae bacterium]